MTQEESNKKFFIVKKHKFLGSTNYSIHSSSMYDLTTAVKKLLALDELKDDADTSYLLQEVNFSMVDKPLVLTDEVKEEQSEMPF